MHEWFSPSAAFTSTLVVALVLVSRHDQMWLVAYIRENYGMDVTPAASVISTPALRSSLPIFLKSLKRCTHCCWILTPTQLLARSMGPASQIPREISQEQVLH